MKENRGKEQLKELRNKHSNTVWLCSDVQSRDGMHDLTNMLMEVISPIYTERCANAGACGNLNAVLDYYMRAIHAWQ